MSHERAISILREFAGRQFAPRVVEVFTGVANHYSADPGRLA
jgi:HD-GYP domain-containing protein (c-di-GMP phosphodiesterase class II)